ncbi:DUF4268 domain-containing protein [Altericista sp. CCNU0014]|uniref:DUF4268 domain-containing protein n=1 Tax=Altericista sp. CCNU0014 TaxID=3082949 RepID=UPI00384EB936
MTSDPTAKPNLGRLEKIDPALYWKNEASDFTPWLTQAENLKLLGEAIGMELEAVLDAAQLEELQSDLLCREVNTGGWVLVGNQLNPSDEKHLGRLLTYAADIDAAAIVWISSQFSSEHRIALDWLNRITQPSIQFFGLEIELWRIGEAAMAARFNLATQLKAVTLSPSDKVADSFTPQSEESLEEEPEPLSEIQQQNLDFWTELCDRLEQRGSIVKVGAPVIGDRINFAIGRAGFCLYAHIDREVACLDVGLSYSGVDTHAYFNLLLEQQDAIEAEVGVQMDWSNDSDGRAFSVFCTLAEADLSQLDGWPDYLEWAADFLERLHDAFSDRIKALNENDFKPMPNYKSLDPLQSALILPN